MRIFEALIALLFFLGLSILFGVTPIGQGFPLLIWVPSILTVIALIYFVWVCTDEARTAKRWEKWKKGGYNSFEFGGFYRDFQEYCNDYNITEPTEYKEFKKLYREAGNEQHFKSRGDK
ncbi:MAG: hypothetical protein LBC44_01585 [Mycoplasmataceae bacterium]|nr:hypothetical protein [Mycoplasmataceae bacterium]